MDTETKIRHESAILYANNDLKGSISLLLKYINASNGYCNTKIWLMLLEIYQNLGQQEAYEKLASFFANRFNFSPPAWDSTDVFHDEEKPQASNFLVFNGSPLLLTLDKKRIFLHALKEKKTSRIDLSRIKIDEFEEHQELNYLFNFMKEVRRLHYPSLLMGETELVSYLIQKQQTNHYTPENHIYWFLLFEIYQWRGNEKKYDLLAEDFIQKFQYCPLGFDANQSIAQFPKNTSTEMSVDSSVLYLKDVIDDLAPIKQFIQNKIDKKIPIQISFIQLKRMTTDLSRQLANYLQHMSVDKKDISFISVSELFASLFEATGLDAYVTLHYRYAKLRDLYNQHSIS